MSNSTEKKNWEILRQIEQDIVRTPCSFCKTHTGLHSFASTGTVKEEEKNGEGKKS